MKNVALSCLGLLIAAYNCHAYRILVVFPSPSKSHSILGEGLVRHVLAAGHEVTYITPIPMKNSYRNLIQIDVSDHFKHVPKDLFSIDVILDKKALFNDYWKMFRLHYGMILLTIQNENVQKLVNNESQQFDLVIADWLMTELNAGFAAIFNCPYVWSSSKDTHWMVLRLVHEMTDPSYVPDAHSTNTPPLDFTQRVQELWLQMSKMFRRITHLDKIQENKYNKYFAPIIAKRGNPVPPFEEVKFNASLMIVNSHISLGHTQPLPPNVINIGGYHIDDKVPPLPEDLEQIMDMSKQGVIYFSMGSNLRASKIPEIIKKGLLKMFGGLKQTVLWKFEEVMSGRPNNVHILNWAPQQSILAHPKCILFITHGGYLSITETVHFGVPIIGIPVFGDQFINVDRAVAKGFAQRVDLAYDMVDKLNVAIEDAVRNPRYKEKVKVLSQIYHDRPVSPGRELVHWVEHVVKTRGAPHLRSPALMLPWYQKAYLDLAAVIIVGLFILVIISKRLYSILFTNAKNVFKQKTK